mmetsp:Transcript_17370/g.48377  ORF Transcript_17370/g.48377 Transcript_17370/m.48377 type:complete len:350 (-) Transcript_17370:1842-2891(-)|eukprot:CAMPEP_0117692036 /NCGR_PEP_ID=MMETSP0804-20121206/26088_1 /TAXON_ID=1074897 /ORGANISM="Tetraselmis astigmatica, Strain CCMP880" /LENGTH=349 /DNA_ID=CAMNT_0005505407 /DNA_START=187 /DNA_END=1236 /DNA_ORIENTATION=+
MSRKQPDEQTMPSGSDVNNSGSDDSSPKSSHSEPKLKDGLQGNSRSTSAFSVASSTVPRVKIDKQDVGNYTQSKALKNNIKHNEASIRHVESSDVLLDMDRVVLQPIPKNEKDKDERSCGRKVKDFVVKDYYVPRTDIVRQLISGVLAGLAVVPESIAFALVVGVHPQVGINTTFVTSLVVGIVGARPGLVNGASGAIAVVIVTLVQTYGEQYMGYCVILAGILAALFALLRLSTLVCLISAPVMVGFVNGLGIIMCLAQVNNFKANPLGASATPPPSPDMSNSTRHLLANYDVFTDGRAWVPPEIAGWMFLEVFIVMASMVLFPMIPWRWMKNIPGSLIGIFLATAAG